MNDIKKAAEILAKAKKVSVLTGAGVSAESNVPTFRGKEGLWRQYRAQDLATPQAFQKDPKLVWEWYGWRQELVGKCSPNPAHKTFAEMEDFYDNFTLISQNVDGLHRRAGSRNVLELHGNLFRARCTKEEGVFDFTLSDEIPPKCEKCGALIRPHIVWFGESLDMDVIHAALEAAAGCDVLLVAGTSAMVQPAASLPLYALRGGARVIEVNLEPTPLSDLVTLSIQGRAGEILPKIWKNAMNPAKQMT